MRPQVGENCAKDTKEEEEYFPTGGGCFMFMACSTLYEMTISVVCSPVSLLWCLYFGQLSYLPAYVCNSESVIKFNNNNNIPKWIDA